MSCMWGLPSAFQVLVACIFYFCFGLVGIFLLSWVLVGVGLGDCQYDSIVGWFDVSGVPLHYRWSRSDCSRSVFSICFIAVVRSVQSSETASGSVFDTSFRAFLRNTSRFSDKFVSAFA